MAQKVITQLIDDITGEEITDGGGRTVQFSVDGDDYEIDLSNRNVDAFREALSDYIAAARKIGVRARGARSSAVKGRTRSDDLARVRVWAMANGYEVAARGRISQDVRDAYDAAN